MAKFEALTGLALKGLTHRQTAFDHLIWAAQPAELTSVYTVYTVFHSCIATTTLPTTHIAQQEHCTLLQ